MSIRAILAYPDPRLRRPAAPVTAFDDDLATLVADLIETLRASGGIGLAAPQVGDARQVLVMDLSEGRCSPSVFINPQVRLTGQRCMAEESCLSVPGVVGNVMRVDALQARAQDVDGGRREVTLEGMPAVCLQHEMDHLAGRLFIDRLPLHRRAWIRLTAGQRRRHALGATEGLGTV